MLEKWEFQDDLKQDAKGIRARRAAKGKPGAQESQSIEDKLSAMEKDHAFKAAMMLEFEQIKQHQARLAVQQEAEGVKHESAAAGRHALQVWKVHRDHARQDK